MRRVQLTIGTALFFVALFGCAGLTAIVDDERSPKVRPADADLVGLYLPTIETVALVAQGGYAQRDMTIVLKADGTFVVNHIPDWWRNFGKPQGGFDSGIGTWRTEQRESSRWAVELHFPSLRDFTPSEPGASLSKGAALFGQVAPYEIGFIVGDPDQGEVMRFRKQPPANPPG